MCDPGSTSGMALASGTTAVQGIGALNSTFVSYFAALGQKRAMNASANMADINAKMSEDNAKQALLAGQREEQNADMKTTDALATQKTEYAAHGIDVNGGGTVGAVASTTQILGETDANTIKANAVRAAWGQRVQATNYTNEGINDRATAKGISPGMEAAGSLITGATGVASSYYSLKKYGYFNVKDNGES